MGKLKTANRSDVKSRGKKYPAPGDLPYPRNKRRRRPEIHCVMQGNKPDIRLLEQKKGKKAACKLKTAEGGAPVEPGYCCFSAHREGKVSGRGVPRGDNKKTLHRKKEVLMLRENARGRPEPCVLFRPCQKTHEAANRDIITTPEQHMGRGCVS